MEGKGRTGQARANETQREEEQKVKGGCVGQKDRMSWGTVRR